MKLIDADKLLRFFTVDTANQTYRFGTIKKQIENAETVQAIIIPDNATNGDVIKSIFSGDTNERYMSESHLMYDGLDFIKEFRKEWWNAPYKRGSENGSN